MKMKVLWIAGLMLAATAGQVQAAVVVYSTGFESGSLGSEWTTASELPTGRVRVLTTTGDFIGQSLGPHSGTYFLGMDHGSPSSAFQANEAVLSLDLTGATNVTLDFWWAEWNDETHAQDGVFISADGGGSYILAQALNGASYMDLTWQNFTVDISALAMANSLSLGNDFRIKFQQYDNYYFAGGNDGFLFDDIVITADAAAVPEPSSIAMFGVGALGLVFARRKRQQKKLAA